MKIKDESLAAINEMKILNNFFNCLRENKDENILELMQDFCDNYNIPLEELGFLISEDKYLKDYVENNLTKYNYIKKSKNFSDNFN